MESWEGAGSVCRQRWGSTLQHPTPSPASASPLLNRGTLLLMGSSGLFRVTQATLCTHPRGMPARITPAAPAPTFPGLLLQSFKKGVTFVTASILPLPPHSSLESTAHFLQLGMYFSSSP